ncbi:disease resistance protein L6-like [Rhodamnia argentea]|uniref:Disease resistance protein L6-like n=1 Tax=Rhodamnia argentea TaxID=178133 RepID=A0ABM3H4C9_9MYRT|nr:disease resistance protein L6-like [Rhodamnia argentea]
MFHLSFGHSFAELVALILLPGLAFYLLNKKKASARRNEEDAGTGAPGSMPTPTEANSDGSSPSPTATTSGGFSSSSTETQSGGCSSSPTEINNGASSSSPTETNNGASSSLTATTGNRYEVFLIFRGPDTRYGFTDHLYHGLLNAGIDTFRDDDELCQGQDIRPALVAAITDSKILIPIFSESYGTSDWCLDELVQMMERKNNNGQIVLPVFYKVKPYDVGHQIGRFGDAFLEREGRLLKRGFDPTILENRKKALLEVSTLSGHEADGYEANLVKSIVRNVLSELKRKFELDISKNLVGLDSHVNHVMERVSKSHATLFVGIHGMGGIGKTTLAKVIYNKLSNQFEHRSFLADIRESWKCNGVHYLQNQLIYDILKRENEVHSENEGTKFISSKFKGKKVLVLLDDVDDVVRVKCLAGKRDWFSSGSKIIITTGNEKILKEVGVDYAYKHEEMDNDQALILFSQHAFRRHPPPRKFKDLTHEAVSIIGGLPLSLEVLGSLLCGEELELWRGTIDKLKKVPPKKVREKLRISYDVLEDEQKQIFLDIACFFIGTDRRTASYMWDACRFFPEEGIEVLRFMSLIKIDDDHRLRMHDQARDLGREIVREENQWLENRSRLWDSEEIGKVLKQNKGTEKIQAIYLSKSSSEGSCKIAMGDFKDSVDELKWLQWENCPTNFEVDNFHATELVVLELPQSKINEAWEGWSSFKQIDSSIGGMKALLCLELRACESLTKLPAEIGELKALEQLLPNNTRVLSALPESILRVLRASHCENMEVKMPESIGSLENLEILDISCTGIKNLPNDIGRLRQLRVIKASYCKNLEGEMPESMCNLSSLQHLDFHGCKKLQRLPDLPSRLTYLGVTYQSRILPSLSHLARLKKLRLIHRQFLQCIPELPPTILKDSECSQQATGVEESELPQSPDTPFKLEDLAVTFCESIEILDVSQLIHLRALFVDRCWNLLEVRGLDRLKYLERPTIMLRNSRLDLPRFGGPKELDVRDCKNLVEIQGLDTLMFLEELSISECASIESLLLPKSGSLKKLEATLCMNLSKIHGLDGLDFLESFYLFECASLEELHLPKSGRLKALGVTGCEMLVQIQGLDRSEFLEWLGMFKCTSIEKLYLPKSDSLKKFYAKRCENLVEIHGLGRLEFLEKLNISRCASIDGLELPESDHLKILNAGYCKSLAEIHGLDRLEFLEKLNLTGCASIERLPILCCFDTLRWLSINGCDMLQDIQSLEGFPSCESLWIEDCRFLAELPNLSNFLNLQKLFLSNCHELREIPGLEKSISQECIAISGCSSIEILPDLSSCTRLMSPIVQDCQKLTELQGLEKLEQLVELDISGCKSLETIPKLSGTGLYQNCEKKPFDSDDPRVIQFGFSHVDSDDSDDSNY